MGESAGIDDRPLHQASRLMQPINQFVLGIRLEKRQFNGLAIDLRSQRLLDIRQRLCAVDLWLSRAQQVEIRAVQYQYLLCHRHTHA